MSAERKEFLERGRSGWNWGAHASGALPTASRRQPRRHELASPFSFGEWCGRVPRAAPQTAGRWCALPLFQLAVVGLLCLGAGIVVGQSEQERSTNVLAKNRETVNSIPKEYGRLVAVERSSEGTTLYLEAQDGTIRFVSVIYGIDHGTLKFKTVTVPRS